MPSFDSFFPCDRPGVPFGTTNEACPPCPRSGSTVATTTVTSAMPPFVMKTLVPLRIQSSPPCFAVVRGERAALDGERDAGAAPVQLLRVDARQEPVRVVAHPLDRLEAVKAPLAGRLDDLPRHALVTIVLRSDGPDDLGSEPACGLLELELFVVEPEIHGFLCLRPVD